MKHLGHLIGHTANELQLETHEMVLSRLVNQTRLLDFMCSRFDNFAFVEIHEDYLMFWHHLTRQHQVHRVYPNDLYLHYVF